MGGHDHVVTFSITTGSDWLRVVLILGTLAVASSALLRPFLAEQGRSVTLAVTGTAGGAVLVLLLLADTLDVPPPSVAVVLAALAVPFAVARHRDPDGTALTTGARRAAPWMLLATTAAAGTEFARAWLVAGPSDVGRLLHTGLMIGLVGLSWLTLCRPRSRRAVVAVHAMAWVLGNAVVAGTAYVAVSAA